MKPPVILRVRKISKDRPDGRMVSCNLWPEANHVSLIEAGFVIDGNLVKREVGINDTRPMAVELAEVERSLVQLIEQSGRTAEFEWMKLT